MSELVEKSLVVLKPDAVQRGLVGEIIARFEKVGLKIVAMKMVRPDREMYFKHYEEIGTMITRHGEEVFNMNVEYMMTGPVIAMVIEGVEAVTLVRKLVGATEPKSAEVGTIRGDFTHMSFAYAHEKGIGVPNLVHASGNADEAKKEIELWFPDEAMQEYQVLSEKYTR